MVSKLNAETTQNQKKILLVDLDETLIYTSDTIPKYPHHKVYVTQLKRIQAHDNQGKVQLG